MLDDSDPDKFVAKMGAEAVYDLLAGLPGGGEVEFSIESDSPITQLARAMFDPILEMKDGMAVMPQGPGWGVRIKPEWLAAAERRVTSL